MQIYAYEYIHTGIQNIYVHPYLHTNTHKRKLHYYNTRGENSHALAVDVLSLFRWLPFCFVSSSVFQN